MAISKKIRFEVFKRDKFTCQYCGREAPDVILELDHIHPVAKGGEDDVLNYATSCRDCNRGKSDRLLSDDAVIKKRKQQLDELQKRREQLEMLLEWQRDLIDLDKVALHELAEIWASLVDPYHLTDKGVLALRKLLPKYSAQKIIEAMRASVGQYIELDDSGGPTLESVSKAWEYVSRICSFSKRTEGKPYLKDLYCIRGILRNRHKYINDWESIQLMEKAYKIGYHTDTLKQVALDTGSWGEWKDTIECLIEGG